MHCTSTSNIKLYFTSNINIIDSNPERQRDKQRDLSNKLLYLNMFDHLSSKRERERGSLSVDKYLLYTLVTGMT